MSKKPILPARTWWSDDHTGLIPSQNIRQHDAGSIAIAVAFCVLLFSVIGWTIFGSLEGSGVKPARDNSLQHSVDVEAVLNQCGDIYTFSPVPEEYGVIPADTTATVLGIPVHPMRVPVYGYMKEEGLPEGSIFRSPDIPSRENILRSLWDGTVVVWFVPETTDAQISQILLGIAPYANAVAIEWAPRDGGNLPQQRNFAFSTWNVSQSCMQWDEEVFTDFMEFVDNYEGVGDQESEPPLASLDSQGRLRQLDIDNDPRVSSIE